MAYGGSGAGIRGWRFPVPAAQHCMTYLPFSQKPCTFSIGRGAACSKPVVSSCQSHHDSRLQLSPYSDRGQSLAHQTT